MWRACVVLAGLLCCVATKAEETFTIDPAKVAQLKRLYPLTPEKLDVFVHGGQLTATQAEYIKKHLTAQGELALPPAALKAERGRDRGRKSGTTQPPRSESGQNPYADFDYQLQPADRQSLAAALREYRHGDRTTIARDLRQFRPEVNEMIAGAYTDPIDLPTKIALWEEVAGPANPDAVVGLIETHRAAYDLARPVLIAHYKDVGGIIVRRKTSARDAVAFPAQRWFTSRELRDMIIELEGLIARCSGPRAASFLISLYGQRYGHGEAPLRDDGRDWRRMVQVCGGNPKEFEHGDPKTWGSTLSPRQRAQIAAQLIPWLHSDNDDRRKIARSGLTICLPSGYPKWDAGREAWDSWWEANKDPLLK